MGEEPFLPFEAPTNVRATQEDWRTMLERPRYPDTPGFVNRDTSKEAAKKIEPETSALRLRILSELQCRASFGATCDELERAMGLTHQTASARIRELNLKGRIRASDARRKTRSGRSAIVWLANEGSR